MSNLDSQPPLPYAPSGARTGNGIAVAALVLGIISIPLVCVWYVSLPCAILAITFGVVGRGAAKRGAPRGGMATAGLVCGLVAILLFVLAIAGCLALLGVTGLSMSEFADQMEQFAQEAQRAAQTMPASGPAAP